MILNSRLVEADETLLLLYSSDRKYAEFCLRYTGLTAGKVMLPVKRFLWNLLYKHVGLVLICVLSLIVNFSEGKSR